MKPMKTLNGYEIVDEKAREGIAKFEGAIHDAQNAAKEATEQATEEVTRLVGELGVVQETGDSPTAVMSQKGTTDAFIGKNGTDQVTAENVEFISKEHSSNMFDKSKAVTGHYISSSSGEISVGSGAFYSDFIPIKVGDNFTTMYSDFCGSRFALVYDENKNPIECLYSNTAIRVTDNGDGTFTYDLTDFPYDVAFIRINGDMSKIDTLMFVINESYPTEYKEYGTKYTLSNSIKITGTDNPLLGKTITFNGDSIMEGVGYSGGFAKIIAEKYGMNLQNVGVSGGTITAETYKQSGSARYWICRTIVSMNENADYAILEGGVNDSSLVVPIGAITDGYDSAFDDTTFCGAFESMLSQLISRFKGKKIGYIAVHKMSTRYDSNYSGEDNYYLMAKKICEKWGVPFLDLNTQVPPLAFVAELKETYTYNGDGWHPNEEGYKKYYVPKIEAWLKTL